MSFTPGEGELYREALGSREVEVDLVTRNYEHTHPQAEYGLEQRPRFLRRLLKSLTGKRSANE